MKYKELLIAFILLCVLVVCCVFREDIAQTIQRTGPEDSAVWQEQNSSDSMPGTSGSDSSESSLESSELSEPEPICWINYPVEFETKDSSYLDDAVFIGDSRTQGLQLGTGLTNPTFLAERGLSVDQVDYQAIFPLSDGSYGTIYDVLRDQKFSKAYLMFGLNELGWIDGRAFVDGLKTIVQNMREIQPGLIIFVQGMIPVAADAYEDDSNLSNDKIHLWNQWIEEMAKDQGCIYLNPGEAIQDETGALPEGAASDGIHMTAEYCQKWLDYLLTHTWTKEETIQNE